MTPPYLQFFDDDGVPLAGGKVYTYTATGTFAVAKATYTTAAASVEHPNPVILDASGRPTTGNGSIWLSGTYDFKVTDSLDNIIETTLNVTAFTTLPSASDAYFQSFSGTGAQTAFTCSEDLGTDEKAIYVWVDAGAGKGYDIQNPSTYTINGTALTFSVAPASGTNNIYVSAPSLLVGAASSAAADAAASAAAAAASAVTAGDSETAAATSAATAASYAASLSSTSTTSLAIGTGAKTFTTQANKQYSAGQYLIASSAASALNYMHGTVTSYSGTSLVMNITDVGGSGTLNDWNISLSGTQGTVGPSGGSEILLNTQAASSSATIDFTSSYITSTYKLYIIKMFNVVADTDGVALHMLFSQSSSFATGAGDYNWTQTSKYSSTNSTASNTSDTKIIITGANTLGNATNEFLCGTIEIYDPTNASLLKYIKSDVTYNGTDAIVNNVDGSGRFRKNANACDGVRLLFDTGTITSGTFKLYGVL